MSWKIVWDGCTRIVLLTDKYAFKIPNVLRWRMMLEGLLANCHERDWRNFKGCSLCPILFSIRGGFLNVMARCTPLTHDQWEAVRATEDDWVYATDFKYENFGMMNGKVVLLDYG